MIVKKHIQQTLRNLETDYAAAISSANPLHPIHIAKLALLEYCGWIEESMDIIVRRSVKGKLKENNFKQMLEYSIIRGNYGFDYKDNFRPMLVRAIGIVNMEKIEVHLKSNNTLDTLITELDAVKNDRNDAAHTWVSGTTKSYPAPSLTTGRLNIVFPIISDIYSQIIRL